MTLLIELKVSNCLGRSGIAGGGQSQIGFGDPVGRQKGRLGTSPSGVRIPIDPANRSHLDFTLHGLSPCLAGIGKDQRYSGRSDPPSASPPDAGGRCRGGLRAIGSCIDIVLLSGLQPAEAGYYKPVCSDPLQRVDGAFSIEESINEANRNEEALCMESNRHSVPLFPEEMGKRERRLLNKEDGRPRPTSTKLFVRRITSSSAPQPPNAWRSSGFPVGNGAGDRPRPRTSPACP